MAVLTVAGSSARPDAGLGDAETGDLVVGDAGKGNGSDHAGRVPVLTCGGPAARRSGHR